MNPVEPDASKSQPRSDAERATTAHAPSDRREPARAPAGRGPAYSFAPGSRVLGGYVIKRGLGQGGFGEVYYAVSDAGKDVAIKLVRRNLEVELRGVMQCLNVKHPNLIALYDVRVDDQDNHWIVMEYVAGERLTDIIEQAPHGLPPREALKLIRGIGAGVGYLHDAGIVHRDLKPANIFVENGFVKIGDYGLSKFISSSRRSGQTESVGTVHYMAPEIANGRYGKQIDIYALGVLFYELLTGKLPFDGESVGEILMKHLTAEPDLSAVAEPYRSAIAAALKKDPEQRPRTVAALLESLDPQADRLDEAAANPPALRADSRSSRVGSGDPSQAHARSDAPVGRFGLQDWVHRHKVMALVFAVFIGIALTRMSHAVPKALLLLALLATVAMIAAKAARAIRAKLAGDAARSAEPRLSLRATEALPGRERPRGFGRGVVAATVIGVAGLVLLTWFGSHSTTVERRGPQIDVAQFHERPLSSREDVAAAKARVAAEESRVIAGRRIVGVGLASLAGLGAAVGVFTVVRRRRGAAAAETSRTAYPLAPAESNEQPTLRTFLIEATGSVLLLFGATLVVNRLLLLVLVDELGMTTYVWSTATTFLTVALTALTIKTMRYVENDSSSRRLTFFAVGAAAGAASWGMAEYLGIGTTILSQWNQIRFGVKPESWPECYVDGVPTALAFMGYYALTLTAVDWWSMTAPRRASRWQLGDAFVAVFCAGAIHFVFPFPQPWGILTLAGTALTLPFAFPLPPKRNARLARHGYA